MEYDRVRWLRRRTVVAAQGMSTGSTTGGGSGPDPLPAAQVPASAFGNTLGGSGCATVWRDVVEQATAANANLARVLDTDANRLDEVIDVFQTTDHESADEICAAPPEITVMSAHLHSHDDASPVWDDYLRATQHDRLVDYAVDQPGPVIVGVDANVSLDEDEYSGELAPDAVERFEDEGFDNVGDFSHGEPGVGTSSSDKSIDYVWSRGLEPGDPQEVEGAPSDHDGMVVGLDVARW
jgi:hypothetical protein